MSTIQETVQPDLNKLIVDRRMKAFNARSGPRVGDYLQLPNLHPKLGTLTRFTHKWDDHIQTGGMGGSYYLADGYMSYSGGLDRGVLKKFIGAQVDERLGSCWFFDKDIHKAHNGVTVGVPCRIFELLPGADLSQFSELESGFYLCICDDEQRKRHGYRYTITHRAISHTAFDSVNGLVEWARKQELGLPLDLFVAGHYSLQYTPLSS